MSTHLPSLSEHYIYVDGIHKNQQCTCIAIFQLLPTSISYVLTTILFCIVNWSNIFIVVRKQFEVAFHLQFPTFVKVVIPVIIKPPYL